MTYKELKVEDICKNVISGGTPSTKNHNYYGGEIPWLRTQEVNFNRIFDTEIKITENGLKNSSAKWIPENTVIVAMYGNSSGRVAINKIPLTTNQACCNLIVDEDKTSNLFLYYYLFNNYEILHGLAKGSAQKNLNAGQIKEYQIQCPELSVQKRIGEILGTYDSLIENNLRRIELLEEAARLLYREWFVHLRFPGHEHTKITNGVPEGWEKGVISNFYNSSSGGTPSRKNPDFFNGEIKWVKTQELNNRFIIDTQEKITEYGLNKSSAKIFPKQTVLIAMYGATIGQLGILAYPSASNQACCALMPKHEDANYIYVFLFLKESKQGLFNISMGSAQNNINQQMIKDFKMFMPSKIIMENFVEMLKPSFEMILNSQNQIELLKQARDILLPRLMNGDIAV
jgi:type I restriction enzyme S subunit